MSILGIKEEISKFYIEGNSKKVIELWENNSPLFDLNKFDNFNLIDAIAVSYSENNELEKSIYWTNIGIEKIKKSNWENKESEFIGKLTFYYFLKSELLRKQNNIIIEYLTVIEYRYLGGNDSQLIKSLDYLEVLIYNKYFYKLVISYFPFFYIFIILIRNLFDLELFPKLAIDGFIILGFIWVILILLDEEKCKKFIINVFRNISISLIALRKIKSFKLK